MDFVVTDLEEIKHMISLLVVYIFGDCGKKFRILTKDSFFFKVFWVFSGRVLILWNIG